MNTALNFVSLPKDTASSVASSEIAADNRMNSMGDPAGKRQDIADGGENNASFAKVLKDETRQEPGKADSPRGNASAKSSDADSGNVNNKSRAGSEKAQAESESGTTQTAKTTDETTGDTTANTTHEASATSVDSSEQKDTATDTVDSRIQITSLTLDSGVTASNSPLLTEVATSGSSASVTPLAAADGETEQAAAVAADETDATLQSGEQDKSARTVATADQATDLSDQEARGNDSVTRSAKQTSAGVESVAGEKQINITSNEKTGSKQGLTTDDNAAIATKSGAAQNTDAASAVLNVEQPNGADSASNRTAANLAAAQSGESTDLTNETSNSPGRSNAQAKAVNVSSSASLESFPAAGDELPDNGKHLPAGLFSQAEGETPVVTRSEQAAQVKGPVDPNDTLTAKHSAINLLAGDKDQETADGKLLRNTFANQPGNQSSTQDNTGKTDFTANPATATADKMLRSIMNSQSMALNTDISTPTTSTSAASDAAGLSPALPNALLHVTADKSLAVARSTLPASTETALNFSITAQAGSAEWQSQLSSRIRWMGDLKLSSAELKLHPAELGAVEIQISTEDDKTRVSFVTSNAAAKEVIESSLPRLRELLDDGGLHLEQGDVAHRDMPEDRQAQEFNGGSRIINNDSEDKEMSQATLHFTRKSTSQIDHYV